MIPIGVERNGKELGQSCSKCIPFPREGPLLPSLKASIAGVGRALPRVLPWWDTSRARCPCLVSKDSHQQAVGVSLAHLEPSPEMDVRAWGGGIQVSASLSWEKGYPES